MRIGIEGVGRTVTVAALSTEDGRIVAAVKQERLLNFYEIPMDQLGTEIFAVVKAVLNRANLSVSEFNGTGGRICAGLSGVTTEHDRNMIMPKVWSSMGLNTAACLSTGDIEICFNGATQSLYGGGIICGVGSVALARVPSKICRVGGWGPLVGDEGSGYWMGVRALQALTFNEDGRSKLDCRFLKEEVISALSTTREWSVLTQGTNFPYSIVTLSRLMPYPRFREFTSHLVKPILRAHQRGDKCAEAIVYDCIKVLSDQLDAAFARVGDENERGPIMLWGGVVRHNPEFGNLLLSEVHNRWPVRQVVMPLTKGALRPVIGALFFAMSGSFGTLPDPRALQSVRESAKMFPELMDY